MKYYLISYGHTNNNRWGIGNIFFKSDPELAIRDAEQMIRDETSYDGVVIITINEISKEQYEREK